MHGTERFQEIAKSVSLGLYTLQRLMGLLHLADSIRKRCRIHARSQLHIALIPVVAVPVIGALLTVGFHRQEDVVVQAAVLGEVLKNTLDGHFQAIHIGIGNLLSDAFL